MKTMRKVFALVLTMAMCAAMSVSTFALEEDPWSQVTTKTYDLGNGIVATITIAPNEITPMPMGFDVVDNALASPTARHTFPLEEGEGPRCGAHVWNDSTDDTYLEAEFTAVIDGKTTRLPAEEVGPRENANFNIENKDGDDLVGKVVTTITALDSDSVRYSYNIEQY